MNTFTELYVRRDFEAMVAEEDRARRLRCEAVPVAAAICAWCPDAEARTRAAGRLVSHTICPACAASLLSQLPS
jgi:hypothetical protein